MTASSARVFPILSGHSGKELLPASSGVTMVCSRTVMLQIPGRTGMDVDVADAEMTSIH